VVLHKSDFLRVHERIRVLGVVALEAGRFGRGTLHAGVHRLGRVRASRSMADFALHVGQWLW